MRFHFGSTAAYKALIDRVDWFRAEDKDVDTLTSDSFYLNRDGFNALVSYLRTGKFY